MYLSYERCILVINRLIELILKLRNLLSSLTSFLPFFLIFSAFFLKNTKSKKHSGRTFFPFHLVLFPAVRHWRQRIVSLSRHHHSGEEIVILLCSFTAKRLFDISILSRETLSRRERFWTTSVYILNGEGQTRKSRACRSWKQERS